mmetsp:Transcript_54767/g.130070  ORF Transcript_54767/g.130070 Transcript_54767/m.130070 type:complete len:277 (-) Transcript_54767:277-1107(-)
MRPLGAVDQERALRRRRQHLGERLAEHVLVRGQERLHVPRHLDLLPRDVVLLEELERVVREVVLGDVEHRVQRKLLEEREVLAAREARAVHAAAHAPEVQRRDQQLLFVVLERRLHPAGHAAERHETGPRAVERLPPVRAAGSQRVGNRPRGLIAREAAWEGGARGLGRRIIPLVRTLLRRPDAPRARAPRRGAALVGPRRFRAALRQNRRRAGPRRVCLGHASSGEVARQRGAASASFASFCPAGRRWLCLASGQAQDRCPGAQRRECSPGWGQV